MKSSESLGHGFPSSLSHAAEAGLGEIVHYISQDNPAAGTCVGQAIVAHFRVLENFSRLGRIVPEFATETLREIIHRPYRLIYQVNDAQQWVEIVRIWHAARGKPDLVQ